MEGCKKKKGRVASPASILFHPNTVNSFTTKKQTTKFSSANFQKILSPSVIILRIQRQVGKQCRSR